MKFPRYKTIFQFASGTLRRLVVGWSLERKSLLFFGVALVLPIGLAFWFVLQVFAQGLARDTTRQSARDYARAQIAWKHALAFSSTDDYVAINTRLGGHLVDNPDYRSFSVVADPAAVYDNLENTLSPINDSEYQAIQELDAELRSALQDVNAERANVTKRLEDDELYLLANAKEREAIVENDAKLKQLTRRLGQLYREEHDPVFPTEKELEIYPALQAPSDGWYVYYHGVHFTDDCMTCHRRYSAPESTPEMPFAAIKVLVPYSLTQPASTLTLAVMITIGMVTVAATLFVIHWVLRKLVLNPLHHLKSVSDEISYGNTELRANIDTGDEFNELAEAFNRMLRHMTDGQIKLEKLNQELDLRVDQLAQANLGLYEANRLKSDFLANMSHELRTPLNSIIGFSDVLRDISSLTDKQRKYATNIQTSGKLLLDMINEILDLAKIEAGKMQVTPTSFAIDHIISAQCDMLRSLVDEKNMDLQIRCDENLSEVFQDQPKIQQILTNLLSNAIKFTPDGGMISVQSWRLSDEYFQIDVTDTGVGIPDDDFEIIFEKFRQSNSVLQNDGLTRQYTGTGLGLSIVKELCKLLGGEIRLTSQLGTGSTFSVILPTHYSENQRQTELPVSGVTR